MTTHKEQCQGIVLFGLLCRSPGQARRFPAVWPPALPVCAGPLRYEENPSCGVPPLGSTTREDFPERPPVAIA